MKPVKPVMHIRRAMLPTVRQLLTRKDGHQQHYHVGIDPAKPKTNHGNPPEELPSVPARKRAYLTGSVEQQMTAVTAYLLTHYPPIRGAPLVDYITTPEKALEVAAMVTPKKPGYRHLPDMAFYSAITHTIYFGPKGTALLRDPEERARLAGMRLLTHEWFHALRNSTAFPPLEEGAAEVFAREVTLRLVGLPKTERNIEDYRPLRQGVQLIGESALGRDNALRWVLNTRVQPDQRAWLWNELHALGAQPDEISEILAPHDAESAEKNKLWYKQVRAALKK